MDGGENHIVEPGDGVSQWLIKTGHEEQKDHSWPQVASQGSSRRMKQLELSFSKILNTEPIPESEDEHTRRVEDTPTKLYDEADTGSSPYIRRTGKMTKKEMREQASRNKSILDGTRKDRNIPEGSREENDCLDGPDGWTENDVKDSGPDG